MTNPQGGRFDPAVDTGVNLSDWNVVDYYDSNKDTGFFGMVLQDPDTEIWWLSSGGVKEQDLRTILQIT